MDFLSIVIFTKPLWLWLVFSAVVAGLLVIDLGLWHRTAREIGVRESLANSSLFIGVGLLFSMFVGWALGATHAGEYLNGYIVEQTLSLDNIFVISMIFAFLGIPRVYQHRVLFWGIVGAIVLRGIMIILGAALLARFEWILYVFAAFLVFTGLKMLFTRGEETSVEKSPVLGFLRNHFKITPGLHGQKFFLRSAGKVFLTPLFVGLVMVEFADVIFAVDSVPAIFAITTDPYIVLTSNIFAIMGLRSLFFSLSAMVARFKYLKVALSWVLIFIGVKVFAKPFGVEVPAAVSLGGTLGLLAWGVLWSLWKTRREIKA